MSHLRKVIYTTTNFTGKIRRNRKFVSKIGQGVLVKVNLGCGLRVAKGWLNIDGSLNAMFASWPNWVHKLLYHFSGSQQYYSLDQYCDILENHQFLYHDLALSLPLHDNTVDFIYSSHFEHIFKDDAANLLKACAKALKPEGIIRISIPDLTYAVSLYGLGKKLKC